MFYFFTPRQILEVRCAWGTISDPSSMRLSWRKETSLLQKLFTSASVLTSARQSWRVYPTSSLVCDTGLVSAIATAALVFPVIEGWSTTKGFFFSILHSYLSLNIKTRGHVKEYALLFHTPFRHVSSNEYQYFVILRCGSLHFNQLWWAERKDESISRICTHPQIPLPAAASAHGRRRLCARPVWQSSDIEISCEVSYRKIKMLSVDATVFSA